MFYSTYFHFVDIMTIFRKIKFSSVRIYSVLTAEALKEMVESESFGVQDSKDWCPNQFQVNFLGFPKNPLSIQIVFFPSLYYYLIWLCYIIFFPLTKEDKKVIHEKSGIHKKLDCSWILILLKFSLRTIVIQDSR